MKLIFSLVILTSLIACKTNKIVEETSVPPSVIIPVPIDELLLGKWTLEYMSHVNGKDVKQLYKIQMPYLNFVDENKVAGNNGCNNISGAYSAKDNIIKFETDKFAATRMFCEGVDEQAFLNVLKSINRYDIIDDGNKLVLITSDIVSMTFVRSKG